MPVIDKRNQLNLVLEEQLHHALQDIPVHSYLYGSFFTIDAIDVD